MVRVFARPPAKHGTVANVNGWRSARGSAGWQDVLAKVVTSRTSLVAVLFGLLATYGCSSAPLGQTSAGPSSEGPLTLKSQSGGLSAYAPKVGGPWTETFSGVDFCANAPVTVTSVDYSGAVAPVRAYATLHWVDPHPGNGQSGSVLSMSGEPGSDSAQWDKVSGRMKRVTASGVHIPPNCANGGLIDLLSTFRVSKQGADVSSIVMHYSAGGHDYTLTVPYRYVACGEAVESRRFCPPGPLN